MRRAWVRGLMQQALDPNESSRKCFDQFVRDVVHPKVKAYVESFAQDPRATAIIFDFLGQPYTSMYLPELSYEPQLLRPPHMLPELRQTLTKDLESGLIDVLLEGASAWQSTEAYKEVQHAFVDLADRNINERRKEFEVSRGDAIGDILLETFHGHAFGLPLADSNDAQQIFAKPEDDCPSVELGSGSSGIVLPLDRWDRIRRNDMTQLVYVCKGKTPPSSIRRWLYIQCFYDQEHVLMTRREILANAKDRSMTADDGQEAFVGITKVADPCVSKINNMLQRLVNESFRVDFVNDDSPGRRDRMLRVLNQYYVAYGKHFAWNYHLLLPLLLEYKDYKLSDYVYVSMLNRTAKFFRAHEHSLEIAGSAVTILSSLDPELTACIRQNLEQYSAKNARPVNALTAVFAGWVEKLFVGVLRMRAVYFLWAQCSLLSIEASMNQTTNHDATKHVLCHACVTIILLLAEDIRQALRSHGLERFITKQARQIRTLNFTNMFNSLQTDHNSGPAMPNPSIIQHPSFETLPGQQYNH